MKKIIVLLLCLLLVSTSFSQSLPIDFSDPNDQTFTAFNGSSVSYTTDPEDATNPVMQINGGTDNWDGVVLNLDTYVDLSNDANNTITFRIYLPLDGSSSNTFLLKFEGSSTAATEQFFTTSGTGWQSISVDFGAGLDADFPRLVLFTDSDASGANTTSAIYYVDDFNGPNGAVIPQDPEPLTAAAIPTDPDAEVLAIYNDSGYTNVWNYDYDFGTNLGEVDLGDTTTNNALKLNLSVAGYGQGTNAVTDISMYNYLQFDYWADASSTEIRFYIMEDDGGTKEYYYEIAATGGQETLVNEQWKHVEIPLTFFENSAPSTQGGFGGFSKDKFFQWKLDASSNLVADFVYLDNIYFTVNASLNVLELEPKNITVYPNPTSNNWTFKATKAIQNITIYNLLGKQVSNTLHHTEQVTITTSNLAAGIYFAKIKTTSGTKTIKLIKTE